MRISDWSSDVCSSDLVLAYAVRKLPFNVRASSAILHQIDPSLEEASINLGVSPTRTFVVLTVPLMLGGIVSGMILTWVTVASGLSATVVLYSGPWTTIDRKSKRLNSRYYCAP